MDTRSQNMIERFVIGCDARLRCGRTAESNLDLKLSHRTDIQKMFILTKIMVVRIKNIGWQKSDKIFNKSC